MNVTLAFLIVILIWSTTPLAIHWSNADGHFLFGVTSRMVLGGVFALALLVVLRHPVTFDRQAMLTWLASGLGIYGAMLFAYWGVMYIPSGWISVIWGVSTIITGVLATVFLKEDGLAPHRMLGASAGILGLAVIFLHSADIGNQATLGVGLILLGVLVQTSTAVWIKAIDAQMHGLVVTTGGLLVSIPLFVISWWLFDGGWPDPVPAKAAYSILYLAIFGSVIGFSLYFFLINRVEASRVSLITLVTPVTALLLGHYLNNEPLGPSVWLGTLLILSGLCVYEWGDRFGARRRG